MTILLVVAALVASVCLLPAARADGLQRGCPGSGCPEAGGGMGGGGGGGGGGGMGGQVIDPPIGAAFRDPPEATDINPAADIVEVNLEAKYATVNVNGTNANLMTFNGSYPGPTIRAKAGDIVKIDYKNSLPSTSATNYLGYQKNITNLHTHGWHVSPEEPADFVMYELWPGQTYHHEYDTLLQEPGTLNFYHPHIHGLAAEQYWAGLLGALVVADETPLLANYETHIMILKDLSLSGTNPAPHSSMMDYMHGKEGSIVMVNGQVNPRLTIKKNQVQRWRVLNGSNARFYKISLDSHTMQLIGADGGLLDKPYAQSSIILSPGERVDILVKGVKSSGNYKFKSLPYSRRGMMGGDTVTLLTLTYSGTLSPSQSVPTSINPNAQRLNLNTTPLPHRTLTLSMSGGAGFINGMTFNDMPYEIHSTLGDYEVWTIVNNGGMDHPFHQHVNAAQVLSITGGDSGYASLYTTTPAMKDTVLVPKWGSVTLLVPVMDYAGMTMFHCHILEHEDIGMMGMWHIMDMPMPMR
jgi:FtsP/CotA-like multicopper oxidase with cupredoxin domain